MPVTTANPDNYKVSTGTVSVVRDIATVRFFRSCDVHPANWDGCICASENIIITHKNGFATEPQKCQQSRFC